MYLLKGILWVVMPMALFIIWHADMVWASGRTPRYVNFLTQSAATALLLWAWYNLFMVH